MFKKEDIPTASLTEYILIIQLEQCLWHKILFKVNKRLKLGSLIISSIITIEVIIPHYITSNKMLGLVYYICYYYLMVI